MSSVQEPNFVMVPENPNDNREPAVAGGRSPDWARLFPEGDHRWMMRLRRGDSRAFFAPRDSTGGVCAERRRWLSADPGRYAAFTPDAAPALADTLELAESLGVVIDRTLDPVLQMLALGKVWEPDFVWLHPDDRGVHRLTGGVVCFPSSWALEEKLRRPIREIHEPVPGLNATLGPRIDQFLKTLSGDVAWSRENVGFSRDAERNHHPARARARLDGTITADEVWIRIEEQLLMNLNPSGSILFGIRVDVYPLPLLLQDSAAADRLIQTLSTMRSEAMAYKGLADARDALIALAGR